MHVTGEGHSLNIFKAMKGRKLSRRHGWLTLKRNRKSRIFPSWMYGRLHLKHFSPQIDLFFHVPINFFSYILGIFCRIYAWVGTGEKSTFTKKEKDFLLVSHNMNNTKRSSVRAFPFLNFFSLFSFLKSFFVPFLEARSVLSMWLPHFFLSFFYCCNFFWNWQLCLFFCECLWGVL